MVKRLNSMTETEQLEQLEALSKRRDQLLDKDRATLEALGVY